MAETIVLEGIDRVQAALQALGPMGPQAMARGLYQEAQEILTTAQERYVPVDLGILRASGFVEPPLKTAAGVEVTVGFGSVAAPYALAVHENPRSGHTGGVSPQGKRYAHWAQVGEWKYLETPWKAAASGMVDRLGAALEAELSQLGRS